MRKHLKCHFLQIELNNRLLYILQQSIKVQRKIVDTQRGVHLLKCIADYKGVVSSQADGQEPDGFALVPETVQVIRAEFLQEILRAGIELHKTDKIRP